jgi:hypothetical protein
MMNSTKSHTSMKTNLLSFIVVLNALSALSPAPAASPNKAAAEAVTQTPGLVAFWDFKEDAGQPRVSTGAKPRTLRSDLRADRLSLPRSKGPRDAA